MDMDFCFSLKGMVQDLFQDISYIAGGGVSSNVCKVSELSVANSCVFVTKTRNWSFKITRDCRTSK